MLKTIWEKWKRLAERIGDFQFGLIFSILYFVFMIPFGFIANLLGDFLNLKGFPRWEQVNRKFGTIKDLREQ